MKKIFIVAILLLVAFGLAGCGSGGDSSGLPVTAPVPPPPVDPGSPQLNLIELTPLGGTTLETNDTDSVSFLVTATDVSGASLEGATIFISTTGGKLDKSQVTTNSEGTAIVTLGVGTAKANQTVTITASSGTVTPATTAVTISGTTLTLSANRTSLLVGGTDSVTLTAEAKDANSIGIYDRDVTLAAPAGFILSATNTRTGAFLSGPAITLATDNNGRATATMTATNAGTATVTATGLGATATLNFTSSSESFAFTSPDDGTIMTTGGFLDLTATLLDNAGLPKPGVTLTFSANSGSFAAPPTTLLSTTAVTDADGKGIVTFWSGNSGGPVTVTVSTPDGLEDTRTLDVRAFTPSRLDLQTSTAILPILKPGTEPSATLTATVRDVSGNRVAGVPVDFVLLSGPGGGEQILPGSATTDAGGNASVTFFAGDASSTQGGVLVRAEVRSATTVFDTVTLTIAGEAALINFGYSNKIETVSSGGFEIGYAMPVTMLVTDINGNPVSGQLVSLGLYPLVFRTGTWPDPNDDTFPATITGTFANEDLNRNGILDAGEDGSSGYGANGKLDPGAVAQVPSLVSTDQNGFATFTIVYLKSSATWITVQITGTTGVVGSESTASINITLPYKDGDTPLLHSPFGP